LARPEVVHVRDVACRAPAAAARSRRPSGNYQNGPARAISWRSRPVVIRRRAEAAAAIVSRVITAAHATEYPCRKAALVTGIAESALVGHDWMRVLAAGGGTSGLATGSLTWMSRRPGQGEDPELFFSIATRRPALSQISAARVGRHRAAASRCPACAVQTRPAGVWGGTTEEARS
jgi:hypothetical protein